MGSPAYSVHSIVAETRQVHMDYRVLGWCMHSNQVGVFPQEWLVALGPCLGTSWCGQRPAVSAALWLRQDKFTWTTESCGGQGIARALSQEESAQTLASTGFYCFSGHITLRMVLIYYAQVHFRWLLFTKNKGEDVTNYIKKEGYLQV